MSVLRLYKLVHFGDEVNLVFSIDNAIAIHAIMTSDSIRICRTNKFNRVMCRVLYIPDFNSIQAKYIITNVIELTN